jgi:opacity protein-like surface antigen
MIHTSHRLKKASAYDWKSRQLKKFNADRNAYGANKKMKNTQTKIYSGLFLFGVASLLSKTYGADTSAVDSDSAAWQKPVWLTDLALGAKESYDDNLLGVSGHGLAPKSSWVSTVSPKVGFNFAPLLGNQKTLQTLSLIYSPDFNFYHDDPSQSYYAHKIGDTIKGQAGDFSFSLDNAFLYNDGDHQAPIYALNQLSGASANQFDQYRNNYAHAVARERLAQTQDRATVRLQYDWDKFFVRPVASLLDYNLMTDWHNTGVAPWKGYQNYVDRYDVNGGMDLGYKLTPKLAATLGYRYGSQYQQQFPTAITSDSHYSSSDYQRVLLGLEGKLWNWLDVKLAGGPDFRNYNSMAPVNDHNPVKYYGEAVLTATITTNQTVTFNYKQWQWVSSTGKVPYLDSTYALTYHWNASKQLGLDLGGKVLEADYTEGNEVNPTGQNSSLRDDMEYEVSAGVTYAFNSHLSANLAYTYDLGDNTLNNLPASLGPAYRGFEHQVVSLGLQYKF